MLRFSTLLVFCLASFQDSAGLIVHSKGKDGSRQLPKGLTSPVPGPPPNVSCATQTLCDVNPENLPGQFCREVCVAGTVEIPPYQQTGLITQRHLQFDFPLNFLNLMGTHNSFITYADGLGLEDAWMTNVVQVLDPNSFWRSSNQVLSVLDQLRMGIRQVEMDVHYHNGDIRLCHAGGVHIEWLDDLVKDLSKALNTTIYWDTELLGCFGSTVNATDEHGPVEWTFVRGLKQIADWLNSPENAEEVSGIRYWFVPSASWQPMWYCRFWLLCSTTKRTWVGGIRLEF